MKAIIVENEDYVAENLKAMLLKVNNEIQVKAITKTVVEALIAIGKFQPEIVFLDIKLDGGKNGIELLEEIEHCNFKVIFTTSYDEYALAAFKLNAVDFLLKPFTENELANAIRKAQILSLGEQNIKLTHLVASTISESNKSQKFSIRNNKGEYIICDFSEIEYLEAEGTYITIYLTDNTSIENTTASLSDFEIRLKTKGFIRIHQKYLVNIEYLKKLLKPTGKTLDGSMGAGGQIILKSGKKLPISRSYYPKIKQILIG